ncbi:MAG: histidine phosphatase family protein [Opitutae bacterium]
MTDTEILLIRHGETEWNLSGRWQGHADSALSPRGISQAKALSKRMKNEEADHFYVSDLERAQHTAKLIGDPYGWAFTHMPELRERDIGVLEGLTTEEMLVKHPAVYKSFCDGGPNYKPPNGESFSQFSDRCFSAIETLANSHPGKKIVAVTHGGVLGAIFRKILKIGMHTERNFLLLNCSVNRIKRSNHAWKLVCWGDIAHLEGIDSLDES